LKEADTRNVELLKHNKELERLLQDRDLDIHDLELELDRLRH